MRVFVTRWFQKFARKEKLAEGQLCAAVARAERGLVDADLGSGLIKQRVARTGEGRSGGYRTLIAYRSKGRAIFLFGFAKNERGNIGADDLEDLKKTAALFLAFGQDQLKQAIAAGELKEIICNA